MGARRIPLAEKITRHSMPEPNTGCWLWIASVGTNGYGSVGSGGNRRNGGKTMGAHRASWEANHGTVPDGMHVCHHCDVKICVNPDHLYLATTAQNTADAVARGRFKRGSTRANARFSDAQVVAIRKSAASGVSCNKLAVEHGVNHAHILKIVRRDIWGHIPE